MNNTFSAFKIDDVGQINLLVKKAAFIKTEKASYMKMAVQDLAGAEKSCNFFTDDPVNIPENTVKNCTVQCKDFKGSKVFNVLKIEESEKKISDFEGEALANTAEYKYILKVLSSLRKPLRAITGNILKKYREWIFAPLDGKKGGILFETYNLIKTVEGVMQAKIDCDKDILLAGAAIYYLPDGMVLSDKKRLLYSRSYYAAGMVGFLAKETASLKEKDSDYQAEYTRDSDNIAHILMSGGKNTPPATREAFILGRISDMLIAFGKIDNAFNGAYEGEMIKVGYDSFLKL